MWSSFFSLSHQAKLLRSLGPNQGLSFGSELEQSNPEVGDLLSRVVAFYSARAAHNRSCPNLVSPGKFEAQIHAESFCTQVRQTIDLLVARSVSDTK